MENTAAIFYRETRPARRQRDRVGRRRARTSPRTDRARDGPPVVRQSRHHAVVGRPLAERRVRDVDGNPPAGRVAAGVEHCRSTKRAPPRRRSTSIRCDRRAPFTPRCGRRPKSRALFDAISYQKGAAVLRMIEHYVGAGPFRDGINAYLEAHAYGNATSEDFWKTIAATSGKAGRPDSPDLHQSAGRAGHRGVAAHLHRGRTDARDVQPGALPVPAPPIATRTTASGRCRRASRPVTSD